jgi:RNA polymerase sigma factor (sigma-70 family)
MRKSLALLGCFPSDTNAQPPACAALARGRYDRINVAMVEGTASNAAAPSGFNTVLVQVGRNRDRLAFKALYDHFAPRLRAYMARLGADGGQADELAQDVMLSVWRRAETFDPLQASASTWIYAIARNRRIDALRAEMRPQLDPNDPALVPASAPPADMAAQTDDDARRLHGAIAALPPEQADLLHMAYFEGKAHSAIATERGLPLGTVKSRLRLALGHLRTLLKDQT